MRSERERERTPKTGLAAEVQGGPRRCIWEMAPIIDVTSVLRYLYMHLADGSELKLAQAADIPLAEAGSQVTSGGASCGKRLEREPLRTVADHAEVSPLRVVNRPYLEPSA